MNFSVFLLIYHTFNCRVSFSPLIFFIFIFLELIFLKSSSPFFVRSRPKYGVENPDLRGFTVFLISVTICGKDGRGILVCS